MRYSFSNVFFLRGALFFADITFLLKLQLPQSSPESIFHQYLTFIPDDELSPRSKRWIYSSFTTCNGNLMSLLSLLQYENKRVFFLEPILRIRHRLRRQIFSEKRCKEVENLMTNFTAIYDHIAFNGVYPPLPLCHRLYRCLTGQKISPYHYDFCLTPAERERYLLPPLATVSTYTHNRSFLFNRSVRSRMEREPSRHRASNVIHSCQEKVAEIRKVSNGVTGSVSHGFLKSANAIRKPRQVLPNEGNCFGASTIHSGGFGTPIRGSVLDRDRSHASQDSNGMPGGSSPGIVSLVAGTRHSGSTLGASATSVGTGGGIVAQSRMSSLLVGVGGSHAHGSPSGGFLDRPEYERVKTLSASTMGHLRKQSVSALGSGSILMTTGTPATARLSKLSAPESVREPGEYESVA